MSGTVNISRDLWDDTAFANDPFSEREAWVWLIAEAAWAERTRRIGNATVTLQRGQVAGSARFFAEAWRWSKTSVARYLAKLKKRDMIRTEDGTAVTVITICKYDDYQRPKPVRGTPSGQKAGQTRDTSGTNDNSMNSSGREEPDGSSARAGSGHQIEPIEAAFTAYNAAAARVGWSQAQKLTVARRSALRARLKDAGGLDGWQAALAKAEASDFLCGRAARGDPFLASFDFLVTAAKFTRLMEGSYDNRPGRTADQPHQPPRRANGFTDAWLSAVGDARMADRQGDDPSEPLLHPRH